MEIKKIISDRFIKFVEHIKLRDGFSNKDIEQKLHLHKNEISNISTSVQVRYVSTASLYWANKIFNANPLYLLNLSDEMFLETEKTRYVNMEEPNPGYGNNSIIDEINLLKKMIADKDEIIKLQKELLNSKPKKYQEL